MRLGFAITIFLLATILPVSTDIRAETITLAPLMDGRSIGRQTATLFDQSRELSLADVLNLEEAFEYLDQPTPSYQWRNAAAWAKIKVENSEDSDLTIIIGHSSAEENVQFIFPSELDLPLNRSQPASVEGFRIRQGGSLFAERDVLGLDHRFPAVVLNIPAHSQHEIYVRVDAIALQFPLRIWTPEHFRSHQQREIFFNAVLWGCLLIMAFYNVFSFWTLKRKLYLWYFLYLASGSSMFLFITGTAYYVHPKLYHFLATNWPLTGMFFGVSITIFSSKVLNFHINRPKLDRVLTLIAGLYFVPVLIFPFHSNFAMYLNTSMIVFFNLFIMILCLREFQNGFRPALTYMLGIFCLWTGFLVTSLAYVGVIEQNLWTLSGFSIGICLEASLLSLTIGWRISLREKQIIASQRLTLEKLNHSYQQMEKVFYRHQIEMIESGNSLESTMPTGRARSAVICFDVIASSQIKHENTKTFLSHIFSRCHELMSENYNPVSLEAYAYRIKEMGDGFLCSVGYPFRCWNLSINEAAVNLAERFHKAFHEEVQLFGYKDPIHCSISVVYGDIEGFYPDSGTMEYDLYGEAVILATRYESMGRVVLTEVGISSSILLLHENVYYSLPAEIQELFTVFDLEAHRKVIRDDPKRKVLFYRLLGNEAQAALLRRAE